MEKYKLIDRYFEKLEKNPTCKKIDQIMGSKYSLLDKGNKSEIIRFFIDDNLDAIISKIRFEKKSFFDYIDKSDLLIIGFCLSGKKIINYRGKNTIKKGEIFYFRPIEGFSVEFFDHDFLYFFLDLNYFKKSLQCRKNRSGCEKLYCKSYGDHICNKGEMIIEKVPYVMKSYASEIKKIKKMEIHNFLDYTNLKSKLFSYLNWFIKLRLSKNLNSEKKRCGLCYASRAKKIIIDNLEDQISVREIAERLDISIYRLQKSFKKVENTTVYNFIRKTKIDNGKIFLKESDLSIMEISQKVGYENPSKFSTAFKNITGLTPSEYRKNNKD